MTQDGNLVVYFSDKRQNVEYNVRRFLFIASISPDVPAFKVGVFTNDFEFWIRVKLNEYRPLTQILPTLLTFVVLPIL